MKPIDHTALTDAGTISGQARDRPLVRVGRTYGQDIARPRNPRG